MRHGLIAAIALAVLAAPPANAAAPIDDKVYALFNPVPADALRPFCPDDPGFGVPPCIIDAGHIMVEWTAVTAGFDHVAGVHTSDYAISDVLLRVGLTRTLELLASWTPLTINTISAGGRSQTDHSTGAATLGVKQSLRNPDGAGFSVAVQPKVTIPTNGERTEWALALPVSQTLNAHWSLAFTPELLILPNSRDSDTHLGGSTSVAVNYAVAAFTVTSELFIEDDRDPAATVHYALANVSLSWMPSQDAGIANIAYYIGADFGLNAATTDVEIYCGLSRRF